MNFEKFLHDKPRNFNHRRMSYVFEKEDGDEKLTDSDVEKIVKILFPKIIDTLCDNINFNANSLDEVARTLDKVLGKIRHARLDKIDSELKKYRDLDVDEAIHINWFIDLLDNCIADYDRNDLKRVYEKSLGISKDIMPDEFVNQITMYKIYTDLQKAKNDERLIQKIIKDF